MIGCEFAVSLNHGLLLTMSLVTRCVSVYRMGLGFVPNLYNSYNNAVNLSRKCHPKPWISSPEEDEIYSVKGRLLKLENVLQQSQEGEHHRMAALAWLPSRIVWST